MREVKDNLATPYQEKGVPSIFRLACSHSRCFLRSISNSAVADVVSLSMPHTLRTYSFVTGWKRMFFPCSMKHTLVPGLMPSFRRSRAGMTIRPLVVTVTEFINPPWSEGIIVVAGCRTDRVHVVQAA